MWNVNIFIIDEPVSYDSIYLNAHFIPVTLRLPWISMHDRWWISFCFLSLQFFFSIQLYYVITNKGVHLSLSYRRKKTQSKERKQNEREKESARKRKRNRNRNRKDNSWVTMNVKRITISNTGRYGQVYLKMMNADWDLDVFTSIQLNTFGSVLLLLLLCFSIVFCVCVWFLGRNEDLSRAHTYTNVWCWLTCSNFLFHFWMFRMISFVVYVVNCATSLRLLSWIIDNFVVIFRSSCSSFFEFIFYFRFITKHFNQKKSKKLMRTSRNPRNHLWV